MLAGLALALAASTAPSPLAPIMDDLVMHAAPDEAADIEAAIAASPALRDTLSRLVVAGKFRGFRVASPAMVATTGPFSASYAQGYMIFTDDFLRTRKGQMRYDAMPIYPNELVFDLGHLAYHIEQPDLPPTPTDQMAPYMSRLKTHEAHAFISGWNDMIDAATIKNGGKALSLQDAVGLGLNLRYGFAFKQPSPNGSTMTLLAGGKLADDEKSAASIISNLENSPLADMK